MSRRRNSLRRLRLAEEFVPAQPWQRSLRRVRARGPLRDPLGQGIIAVSSAILTAASGFWMLLLGHNRAAGLMLCAAAVEVTVYVALAARAFKRDKAVQFWQERRQLRLSLGREEVYRRLLLQAFSHSQRTQREPVDKSRTQEVLDQMIELTFSVFAPAHDDLAVLLVHEANGRCAIAHSALSQGSRWHELRSGKHCFLKGDLGDRLQELAPYHEAQLVGTSAVPLWLIVLHDSPFSKSELELLHPLPGIFELIANQKSPEQVFHGPRPLRALG